jgi:hypothetical protein
MKKLPDHIIKDEHHLSPAQMKKYFIDALREFVAYQERNHGGDWSMTSIFNEFDFAHYGARLYAVGNAGYGDSLCCDEPNTYRYSHPSNRWRDLDHKPPRGMLDLKKVALLKSA